MSFLKYTIYLCLIAILCSCQVKRYLPENEYLYKGATLDIQKPDSTNTTQLRSAALTGINQRTTPRWRVWWHYREKAPLKWLGNKIGRAPTFYEDRISEQTLTVLQNRATNQGHFYSLADYRLDTITSQQAIQVEYTLKVGAAYTIDTLRYAIRDSSVARVIDSLQEKTLIKQGEPYTLQKLKQERQRLENGLRDRGYYFFSAQDLEFLGDTIGNHYGVILLLKLKDDIPERHLQPQRIRRVLVYSNYQRSSQRIAVDTTRYEGLEIICNDCPLRPEIMAEAVAQRPGLRYQPRAHDQTIERLAGYNTFQYISLNYEPVAGREDMLDLYIYLTPQLRRTVSGEVGAAYNSGRYFGPEVGFSYANRNLLRGAELFTLEGDLTYNFFLGNASETRIPSSGIYGLSTGVQIPRLWLPKRELILPEFLQSSTAIELGFKLESIQLQLSRFAAEIENNNFTDLAALLAEEDNATAGVQLWQLSGDYGYRWRKRTTIVHDLKVLRLRYQNPNVSTEELLSLSRSLGFTQGQAGLGRLDRMFLFGPAYRWIYDSRLRRKTETTPRSNYFLSLQGGLVFNRVLPVGDNQRELVSERSNYVQPELDARYYFDLNPALTIAARVHSGIAMPFSRRAIVPYFDLYTVGGPNSLRGFIPRGLGPGVTVPVDNNLLGQNGYGNVLFESSLELRYRLGPLFQVVAFADAGNVWLYRTENDPTPGDFTPRNFGVELATDAGLGIRVDLSFIVIRLDVAQPISVPYRTSPEAPLDRSPRFVLAFGQAF